MKVQELDVCMIRLDLENYRTYHNASEPDALRMMVQVQGKKIVELAEDIIENGLSPIETIAVVPEKDDFHTVIEGNRRITVLKLLENPSLAGDASIEKAFSRLKPEFLKNPIRKISCAVFSDRETIMKWADRKHGTGLGGASLDRWGYVSNARRSADLGDYNRWIAALDYLREQGDPIENAELEIDRLQIGALITRIFGSEYLSKGLGVTIKSNGEVSFENGDDAAGRKLLKQMILDLIARKPTTDEYRYKEDWVRFFKEFDNLSVKKSASTGPNSSTETSTNDTNPSGSRAGDGGTTTDNTGGTKSSSGPKQSDGDGKGKRRPARRRSDRTKLVPKGTRYSLHILNDRINDLYHELLELDVSEKKSGVPNVGAIMIRVFLDLALTHYLSELNVPLDTRSQNKRGASSWKDIGVSLPSKLNAALKDLDPNNSKQTLKPARQACNKDFHHSIDVLHERVHGLDATSPTHKEVIEVWDRYHPLFEQIFEKLTKAGK